MKDKLLLLAVCCLFYTTAIAQTKKPVNKGFTFGTITPEDFAVKSSGVDSAASAIVIFNVGELNFDISPTTGGFVYVFQRHVRIKILNKSGVDWGDFKIWLYKSSNNSGSEVLNSMSAASYNMVDGKMVTSKLNKDAKFTEEFDKNRTIKKYALANVKEGSVIEFKYKITSDFIWNLRDWDFQTSIPTKYSEFNLKIPEYLKYKNSFKGFHKITQAYHDFQNASYGSYGTTDLYDQYIAEDVPALRDEPYITTLDDYRTSVGFELQATQFPGAIRKDFNGTWPKIIDDLLKDENFGLYLKKNSYAKSTLPDILKGEKDTLKVANLIFNHVKKSMKWNGSYNFYTSGTNPKTLFDKKTGNAADINLSLVTFLNTAGITAYPVILSTRSNGTHSTLPIQSQFNNVIALISIGNKAYFLDATDRDMPLGMVSFNNLNHIGFYIDTEAKSGEWIGTEPEIPTLSNFVYNLKLDTENKLTGNIYQYNKGYAALNRRDKYRSSNNEADFLKDFKAKKTGLSVENYKITNLDNLDDFLTEAMDVTIEDNVEEAGNLVYFTPLLYERTKENLFKSEDRKFPVDFAYPFKETYTITVDFPENYDIDKLPKGVSYKLPDNKTSFTITYVAEGKKLMVKSVINANKAVYTPEEYFDLKELFKAIVSKQAEQIVFKKKS